MKVVAETPTRRFRPGRWLYRVWYQPLGWFERSWREGGPIEQWRTARGRNAMRQAAAMLRPITVSSPSPGKPSLFFLSGASFWEQTVFCLRSLQAVTPGVIWPVGIIDDGTLHSFARQAIERAFPGIAIFDQRAIESALDHMIPAGRFPSLRAHRITYKHLRKITDVPAVHPGWNAVLDSDMLFHAAPDEFLRWFRDPQSPLVLTDVANAYGYSEETLAACKGVYPPKRINVGITGLSSAQINWSQVEHWTYTLLCRHGSSYFLEQALVALMLAEGPFGQLDEQRYRVKPTPAEIHHPTALLHHYVADSKRDYLRQAWRRFA